MCRVPVLSEHVTGVGQRVCINHKFFVVLLLRCVAVFRNDLVEIRLPLPLGNIRARIWLEFLCNGGETGKYKNCDGEYLDIEFDLDNLKVLVAMEPSR